MQSSLHFLLLLIIAPALLAHSADTRESYKNYHVLEIPIHKRHHLHVMHTLSHSFDFLSLPNQVSPVATVMLAPHQVAAFAQQLDQHNITRTRILTADLNEVFDREQQQQMRFQPAATVTPQVPIDHFARHREINAYLDHLATTYPQTVTVHSAGRSHEGRDLRYARISNGNPTATATKRVIFVDAGIHAREWIAPATALYALHQLAELSAENADLLADTDWIVLPCVNPDGYEYTHDFDRMWRKTRGPNAGNSRCPGTDGNRNFAYEWGGPGASVSECQDTYRGRAPLSEPETRAVSELMKDLGPACKFYLTLHSYGNMLLYPWGFTHALPDSWRDLDEVASAGAQAIERATGSRYWVASAAELYLAAGGSDDYALGEHGIPIAITMELPGGFVVPTAQIRASVQESWIGIRAMALRVIEKY